MDEGDGPGSEGKGAVRPVPFGAVVPKQGAFPPKDRFVWTYVNTAIALGDHLEEVMVLQ